MRLTNAHSDATAVAANQDAAMEDPASDSLVPHVLGAPAREARKGRPRSEEAHRSILAATLSLLAERGYSRLTMDAIAAEAGVGKATLYRWWSSREALVVEAIHGPALAMIGEPQTGTLAGDVSFLVANLVELFRSPLGAMLMSVWSEMQHEPRLEQAFNEVFLERRQELIKLVMTAAGARGELRPGLDLEAVSDMVLAAVIQRARTDQGSLDASYAATLVDIVLNGISLRSHPHL